MTSREERDEESANKAVVRAMLDGNARGDAKALADIVHADVVWWVPVSSTRNGVARPLVGSDAVVKLLSGAHGFFRAGTTTWTVLRLVEEDGTVIAHVQRRCLTSTGHPYENEYLLRFDLVDGRIKAVWEHTDTARADQLMAEASPES